MKVLIDIPDDEAAFGMKVLKSLSFVAAEQVRLHKQGKLKLKTAQELIDEL